VSRWVRSSSSSYVFFLFFVAKDEKNVGIPIFGPSFLSRAQSRQVRVVIVFWVVFGIVREQISDSPCFILRRLSMLGLAGYTVFPQSCSCQGLSLPSFA
jgi:hypothetical protein